MVEVDIDKILENSEKKEVKEKAKSKTKFFIILGAAVLIAAGIISLVTITIIGESSAAYMPFVNGAKYTYNRSGKSPEEWNTMEKTKNIDGYVCQGINKVDKGTNLSYQDYYCVGKSGIVRIAYSENFGQIKESPFGILPGRIKAGKEFEAGNIKDKIVYAKILAKEKVSTPVGVIEALKVEYSAEPYYHKTVWYGKGIGVIKEVNDLTNEERSIINVVN